MRFVRYELRTTDTNAARTFYENVLGHDRAKIWLLHEQALARGATPHWLGHIAVDDVEGAAARFIERGATALGPMRPTSYGGQAAVLRDPGGAVVAVATEPGADTGHELDVTWHVLNTNDVTRAIASYEGLFGWDFASVEESSPHGSFRAFAWRAGAPRVGAFAGIADRPNVHPHWLFFFEVDALDASLASVRAGGGLTLDPIVMPNGDRLAVCDDAQGAAFGLRERGR